MILRKHWSSDILHYSDKLKTEIDPVKRDVLLKLLAGEEAKDQPPIRQ